MDAILQFENREDWRSWLEKNHDKETWAWLTFHNKSSGSKGITLAESVEEAMCFGWIDGKLKKIDAMRFIVRFSPRKAKSVWSKINKERAERLVESGRMAPMGLAKIKEARESGNWDSAYTNRTTDRVPVDLKEALMKDKNAWNHFQNFANTYRNMYIGWVVSAKTNETRRKRLAKVVEQAMKNKKLLSE